MRLTFKYLKITKKETVVDFIIRLCSFLEVKQYYAPLNVIREGALALAFRLKVHQKCCPTIFEWFSSIILYRGPGP